MDRRFGTQLFYTFILFAFFLVLGCTTTKNMVKKITPSKPAIKKQVMVFPFLDFSRLDMEKTAQITSDFISELNDDSSQVFRRCPEGVSLPTKTWTPEYMTLAHKKLAEDADTLGMNAVIYGTLNPIEIENKRTGIWPFRHSSKAITVSMLVNVVDVADGCLFLTSLLSEQMVFDMDETENTDETTLVEQAFEKTIPRLLKHQTAAVIEKLGEEPWTGKILDVSAETMKINAGKENGVELEQRFEVYEQGESILCLEDNSIDLLGKVTGLIEVTSVMDDHSLAVAVTGGPFAAGQAVRLEQ